MLNIIKKIKTIPDYIKAGRIFYALRLYFRKQVTIPVFIKTKTGARFFLGFDKVDDLILKHLHKTLADVYFPHYVGVKTNDVIVDVGGHHGMFAIEMASRHPAASIFSFEPDISSYRMFRFNRRLNNNKTIRLYNAALDTVTGSAYIIKSNEGSWGNYVADNDDLSNTKISKLGVQDFLNETNTGSIQFLKVNAEGAEFKILPAFFKLQLFPENMLIFLHPEMGNADSLLDLVRNNGYDVIRFSNDPDRPWYLFKHRGTVVN